MRSLKTRGVVIKRINYDEADKILTIFTERFGKIKVMAKGVRRISSKLAGNLEPYNLIDLQLHQGKTFFIVTGAEIIECYDCDKQINSSSRAVYTAEIVDKIFAEEEKNSVAFEYFVEILRNIGTSHNELAIRLFELKILEQAGFRPDLEHCAYCKNILKAGENCFNENTGEILCVNCANSNSCLQLNDEIIKLLRILQKEGIEICDKIKCESRYIQATENIIDKWLENALERELKSKKYLK